MDWVQIASFGLTAMLTVGGTTWSIRAMLDNRDAALMKMMTDHEAADNKRFAECHKSIADSAATITNYLGETGRAIREHMHQIELGVQMNKTENLETFVRRDSYYQVMKGLDARFDKIEVKIDGLSAS